jgi:hypothetical protein
MALSPMSGLESDTVLNRESFCFGDFPIQFFRAHIDVSDAQHRCTVEELGPRRAQQFRSSPARDPVLAVKFKYDQFASGLLRRLVSGLEKAA